MLAVGNAPTALLTIAEKIENGLRPALVIGVPVGFVNVVESKERLFAVCESHGVPAIVAMGQGRQQRGGGHLQRADLFRRPGPHRPRMEISRRISPQPGTALFGAKRIPGYCYLTAAL